MADVGGCLRCGACTFPFWIGPRFQVSASHTRAQLIDELNKVLARYVCVYYSAMHHRSIITLIIIINSIKRVVYDECCRGEVVELMVQYFPFIIYRVSEGGRRKGEVRDVPQSIIKSCISGWRIFWWMPCTGCCFPKSSSSSSSNFGQPRFLLRSLSPTLLHAPPPPLGVQDYFNIYIY